MAISRVYLVDASSRMGESEGVPELQVPKIELVKSELTQLLGGAENFSLDDRVAVMSFKVRSGKSAVKTVIPFQYARAIDPNYVHLIGDISTANAGKDSPIAAALKEALSKTASENGEREILLIAGSGFAGDDPRLLVPDALMQRATINVICFGLGDEIEALEALARRTGGALRIVRRPVDLHRYLFYPPDPPPLDAQTEELVSSTVGLLKQYDSTKKGGATGTDLIALLKGAKARLSERYDALGRELAVMTLDRQEPLIKITALRHLLEKRKITKKEHLQRSAEPEEFMGELARRAKAKQNALRAIDSMIDEIDSRLYEALV